VMRAADGRVKILDFGLARSTEPTEGMTVTKLTQAGGAVGTPGYMAPEQLSGGTVDARTDVFAFGIVAIELATGEHPFGPDSASMLRRMTELMAGRTVSASGAWGSPEIQPIALRCLRAAPAERYASGAELVTALQGAGGGAFGTVTPAGESLWWWQFHQAAIGILLAAMPALAWFMRRSIGTPWGSRLFFAALILATISIAARMNLLFTSRVHPGTLEHQRSLVFPWVAWIDATLAILMAAASIVLEGEDALAGFTIALATVNLASVALIEPATTRAAGMSVPGSASR
jgi:hypothetical protein